MRTKAQKRGTAMPKTARKSAKKKTVPTKSTGRSKKATASPAGHPPAPQPLVNQQPQSKQQAALAAGVFLQTTDAWSEAYWDPTDLHVLERELFG